MIKKIVFYNYNEYAWKVSKYEVFSGPYFPVFSPDTGKYGPEKFPYFDSFRTVSGGIYCKSN